MNKIQQNTKLFSKAIVELFGSSLDHLSHNPAFALFLAKAYFEQKKAALLREDVAAKGISAPALMIASVTKNCNLSCAGCYAKAHERVFAPELTTQEWKSIFSQAQKLGISLILIAGGEPFSREDLLDILRDFPHIIFPVFTNGLLLNDTQISKLSHLQHVIPLVSIEGFDENTDCRRGKNVYASALEVFAKMRVEKKFFGVSITATRENFTEITAECFIRELIDKGAGLFVFVEYAPIDEKTQHLVLLPEQRDELLKLEKRFHKDFGKLAVVFPGDEEKYGGCMAAGRGFFHVSAEGYLEPCPFAPFSQHKLPQISLAEALSSEFFATIRANHDKLTENGGGCALWNNREWVKAVLNVLPKNSPENQ